jgi:hypothetical protein
MVKKREHEALDKFAVIKKASPPESGANTATARQTTEAGKRGNLCFSRFCDCGAGANKREESGFFSRYRS